MEASTSKNLLFFSEQESAYVREHYPHGSTAEIARHLGRNERAIRSHAFQINVKKVKQAQRKSRFLTPQMQEILALVYSHMSNEQISQDFGIPEPALAKYASQLGLKKDPEWRRQQLSNMAKALPAHCKFQKGQTPWSKGISDPSHPYHQRGVYTSGRHHNQRDIGSLTFRARKVGSEMVNYLYVKTEPRKWVPLQVAMWQEYHQQSLPPGHIVVFKNGDRLDFNKDNLMAVTMPELSLCRAVYGAPLDLLPLVKQHAAIAKLIAQREEQASSQNPTTTTV